MIDEKKLIEILKKREELIYPSAILEVAGGHEIYDEQSFGRYSELGIISNIVERLAEENNGGWILCSERLPDKKEYLKNDGRFIVTDGNRVYQSVYDIYQGKFRTLKIRVSGWVFADDNCVIAWQPLPEHYRAPAAEPKMTNADRIRNMTDEELAKFIHAVGCNSHYGDDCGYPFCHSMEGNLCHGIKDNTDAKTLEWLKSEVVKE